MAVIYICDLCKGQSEPQINGHPMDWHYVRVTSGQYFQASWNICEVCGSKFGMVKSSKTSEDTIAEVIREIVNEEIDNHED